MVSVVADGCVIPRLLVALPETVTSLSSDTATALSTAVIVTAPVLAVPPAATVSVVPACVKSPATAPVDATGGASTVTVVGSTDGCDSAAFTVETSPFSEIDAGSSISSTVGAASLSVVVTATSTSARPS